MNKMKIIHKNKQKALKTICVIPARYGSTRLPGKPLLKIKELPLILWVYNRAKEANIFNAVYIATDDERIFDCVNDYGGNAIMTSVSHNSGTDRILEAIQGLDCTHIVNLQGDEPAVPVDLLRMFAAELEKLNNSTLLTCISHATIEDNADPNVVKVVLSEKNYALYFSRSAIPYNRDNLYCARYKHIGIYGFSRPVLKKFCSYSPTPLEKTEKLEQLRALEMGMKIRCLFYENYNSTGIDTLHDLERFRLSVGDA